MDFVRMSVIQNKEETPSSSESKASVSRADSEVVADRFEKVYTEGIAKCSKILPLIVDSNFRSKYWTLPIGIPDCYVFLHRSYRCLILEAVTMFQDSQIENMHTYNFTAHPHFENKLNAYTRFKGPTKPNQNLVRSRTWDVALNVVLKIEALCCPFDRFRYLLKREYRILDFLWSKYIDSPMDIDEMTGIPMVFEFVEVPNTEYCASSVGHINEIDNHGKLKQLSFPMGSDKRSTLTYMSMEKLGPNVSYLQQLVRVANRSQQTFDLWTALKIFDQLLCRIMQIHRLGVVHNDICPENIYVGNGVAFNVVYLNNYKRAYILSENDKEGPGGLASSCIGCNVRFASVAQLSGSPRLMRPIDDIESAFYLLVALLNADILPWDNQLKSKDNGAFSTSNSPDFAENFNTSGNNSHDANWLVHGGTAEVSTDTIHKVFDIKQRFWNSNQMLNMILSNSACIFNSDTNQSSGVTSTIREIYYRLKDWRHSFKSGEESFLYSKKLARPTSEEFRNFCELRKCALIYFKFAETFDILNDITFRNKVDNQTKNDMMQQQPWNYLVWCFNNIEIKPDNRGFSINQQSYLIVSASTSDTAKEI